jgi:hypothetical protein
MACYGIAALDVRDLIHTIILIVNCVSLHFTAESICVDICYNVIQRLR